MRLFLYALSSSVLVLGSCVAGDDSFAEQTSELKPGTHFIGEPTCDQTGSTLTCAGAIGGLGNRAVIVELVVERTCTNRGGNNPPGQVKAKTGPIEPENGRIDFLVTVSGGCPDQMVAKFTSPATINVFDLAGRLVFTGKIFF